MGSKPTKKPATATTANGHAPDFDPLKNCADILALGKESAEALLEAATVATSGVETIAGEILAYSHQSIEANVEAANALFAAKSAEHFFALQTAWVKNASEGYVEVLTRIGSLASNTAQDVFEPLQSRAAAFVKLAQTHAF